MQDDHEKPVRAGKREVESEAQHFGCRAATLRGADGYGDDKPTATVVGNNVGQLKAGGPIAVAAPQASSYVVAGPKRGKSPTAAKAKKAVSRPASPRARKSSQEKGIDVGCK